MVGPVQRTPNRVRVMGKVRERGNEGIWSPQLLPNKLKEHEYVECPHFPKYARLRPVILPSNSGTEDSFVDESKKRTEKE